MLIRQNQFRKVESKCCFYLSKVVWNSKMTWDDLWRPFIIHIQYFFSFFEDFKSQKQKCRNNVCHENILAVIIACFDNIYSTLRYLQVDLHSYFHPYIIVLIILSRSIIFKSHRRLDFFCWNSFRREESCKAFLLNNDIFQIMKFYK